LGVLIEQSMTAVARAVDVRRSAKVDAQSPETLLEKSDEAMYHSKKTGRNGVSFFGVDSALVSRRRRCGRTYR
jgi:predicted signal transduction protein with EAL and GGDEF domain